MDKVYAEAFKDKIILVTGGTGSIGSEIVKKVLKFPVKQVRVFSRDEYKQYRLAHELKNQPLGRVSFLIGDIRDRDRVFLAMEGVNYVFNAAAMKHVPLCEFNPFEAIKTNVLGTQNLIDASRANNVDKFIHISTDKAALPVNVMGATKLLAEKIAISAENYKGAHKTVFAAVRFGNVFGSRGSVVPLFYNQIKNGGPVTITDPAMTRFIMQIPEAVELVLKVALHSQGEELFVLKMPVMNIELLAKAMIEVVAPQFGFQPSQIKIEVIGKRGGEKMYELLLTEDEMSEVMENNEMFCITKHSLTDFHKSNCRSYRSSDSKSMKYEEIVDLLKRSLPYLERLSQ